MFGGEVCGQGEGSELKTVQIPKNILDTLYTNKKGLIMQKRRPSHAAVPLINEAPAASQTTFIIGQFNFACVMVHKNKPLWRSS
jgi:hypothetical protein